MFQRKRWGGVGKVPRGFVCSFLLLIFVAASLLFPLSARAESGQADLDGLAPYADDGDLDYIPDYFVTVDLREDGSADIVYDITWQVIDGDQTDYLSWVKIGLPNAYAEDLTPLTDTISDLQYTGDGGSYAKVVFARRYYSPKVAAQNGGESRVRFAFSVHQSHLFSLNSDGTATFEFTPGWFDDLVVEHMQVRWRSGDGFVADNTSEEDGYLIWDFGPMGHGQSANIHVTVPVTTAETFDPDAQLTAAEADPPEAATPLPLVRSVQTPQRPALPAPTRARTPDTTSGPVRFPTGSLLYGAEPFGEIAKTHGGGWARDLIADIGQRPER